MQPNSEHRDRRISLGQLRIVEHREPALDGGHPAAAVVGKDVRCDDPGQLIGVAGCGEIVDRRLRLVVRFAPRRGTAVEGRDELGLASPELSMEHLLEEVVVAKPLAPMVERDDEQILLLELLEHLRRVVTVEHCVTEEGAHPV